MKLAQRSLLLLVIFLLVIPCSIYVFREPAEIYLRNWENVYVERFISKICKNSSVTYEDYLFFHNSLSCSGGKTEISIDEYKPEQDLNGKYYYAPVTWEEIKDELQEEKNYYFVEGSIVRIVVIRKSASEERIIQRFGRISERNNSGT